MSGHRGDCTTVVLFTRDLRVHDHPTLAEAAAVSERVVPLFVLDDSLLASDYAQRNRVQFLLESLADLHESLRALDPAERDRLEYCEPLVTPRGRA